MLVNTCNDSYVAVLLSELANRVGYVLATLLLLYTHYLGAYIVLVQALHMLLTLRGRRLVAVELKLEHFQAGHKGQMELYLRWLDRYERQPTEEAPIGLILCASVNREEIEVLQLDGSSIRVAEYLTELPDREALRVKLHQAIELARNKAVVALPHAKDRGEEI